MNTDIIAQLIENLAENTLEKGLHHNGPVIENTPTP